MLGRRYADVRKNVYACGCREKVHTIKFVTDLDVKKCMVHIKQCIDYFCND